MTTSRWGDYAQSGDRGRGRQARDCLAAKRRARRRVLVGARRARKRSGGCAMSPIQDGLQLHVVERPISAEDLTEEHIPSGTRSVSVFLVNHRERRSGRKTESRDLAYAFQPEIEVQRPSALSCHGRTCAARGPTEWDEQVADLHYADTPEPTPPATACRPSGRLVDGACHLLRTAWIPERRGGEDGRPWTCRAYEL